MFKNATIYRIAAGWNPGTGTMHNMLRAACFVPCGATQDKSVGWVEPRGEDHGALVESVAGQHIMKLRIETKSVPGSEIKKKVKEIADQIEDQTGRKPGKKETKAITEDVVLSLLPQAFAKQSHVLVWHDPVSDLLVVDASSQGQLDEVVTALVRAFDGMVLALLQTTVTPQTAMTQWLSATDPEDVPGSMHIERECELKGSDEEKAVVKFSRHNLATDEVRQHISEGKLPTMLAMSWEGRLAFTLTETMKLKKLKFLEGVFDGRPDEGESGFDADVALLTGELQRFLPELVEALGGEMAFGQKGAQE